MVLPKLPEEATVEEIREAYFKTGWTKILEFDWVEVVRGTPHLKRYRFNADALPCDNSDDVQYQLTFVQLMSTGVMKTCAVCGKTDGPITTELGIQLSDRQISPAEAWKIVQETGQYPPVGLDKPDARRRVRIITR